MDIVQAKLKALLRQSDLAFEALKHDPSSLSSAEAYERAKTALDVHIAQMRAAIEKRLR